MTKINIKKIYSLIDEGHEIEFVYNGKCFSITYGIIDGRNVISFCEFYQASTEVTSINDLLKIKRYGKSVEEMITSLSDDKVWIF